MKARFTLDIDNCLIVTELLDFFPPVLSLLWIYFVLFIVLVCTVGLQVSGTS